MPSRPREHQIEEISRICLREAFASVGWVVEELRQDYGEDLFVRIFRNGEPTPLIFFVQAKSTDHIDKYKISGGRTLSYPISAKRIETWARLSEPVLVTLCDIESGMTYWQVVPDHKDSAKHRTEPSKQTVRFHIPVKNKLDDHGLAQIYTLAAERFQRLERVQHGLELVLARFEDRLGKKVNLDSEMGILFLDGKEGGWEITLFGAAGEMIADLSNQYGIAPVELYWRLLLGWKNKDDENELTGDAIIDQRNFESTRSFDENVRRALDCSVEHDDLIRRLILVDNDGEV